MGTTIALTLQPASSRPGELLRVFRCLRLGSSRGGEVYGLGVLDFCMIFDFLIFLQVFLFFVVGGWRSIRCGGLLGAFCILFFRALLCCFQLFSVGQVLFGESYICL